MADEWEQKKIDLTSTVVEKGIDLVKEFLDKLLLPAVETTGLLISERISLFRFNNQVNVLKKARQKCVDAGIQPSSISFKLLCPLLEGASLEETEEMQEVWATMLANMVDTNKNLQNHVFPYLLSQLSLEEWEFVEQAYTDVLQEGQKQKDQLQKGEIDLEELKIRATEVYASNNMEEYLAKSNLSREIRALKTKVESIKATSKPSEIKDWRVEEDYHLPNLIRLGICEKVKRYSAELADGSVRIEENEMGMSGILQDVHLNVDEVEDVYYFTDLGLSFIKCCSESEKGTV